MARNLTGDLRREHEWTCFYCETRGCYDAEDRPVICSCELISCGCDRECICDCHETDRLLGRAAAEIEDLNAKIEVLSEEIRLLEERYVGMADKPSRTP